MASNIINSGLNLMNTAYNGAGGIVLSGDAVKGGYFVTDNVENIPSWSNIEGTLCYVTGTTDEPINKFYQYNGEAWVEAKFGSDVPLEPGTGYNSIVHSNTEAKAISENAIAEQGSFAGLKGFIFNDSNTVNPNSKDPSKFSEFNQDGSFILRATNSAENPVEAFYYAYNSEINGKNISFINGSKYMNYATVTMKYDDPILTITSATINPDAKGNATWNCKGATGCDAYGLRENRPYDEKKYEEEEIYVDIGTDECTFFFLDFPDAGYIDVGANSRASGINTKALGQGNFAAGKDTIAQAQYSAAFGRGTSANYACMAINRNCKALGDNSFAGGNGSVAQNLTSMAWGNTVHTSRNYQIVLGQFNADNTNANFIIGNGYNASAQHNALEITPANQYSQGGSIKAIGAFSVEGSITTTGTITAGANPTANMHVATKQYVDTSTTTTKQYVDTNTTTWRANTKVIAVGAGASTSDKDGIAIGSNTKSYYGGNVVIGSNSQATHQEAFSIGFKNIVNSKWGCAIGTGLRTSGTNALPGETGYNATGANSEREIFILGRYNNYKDVTGKQSSSDTNANAAAIVFGIGTGDDDEDRKNGMIIYFDGHITGGRSTEDDDPEKTLVTKDYVENYVKNYVDTKLGNIADILSKINDGGIE